MKKHEVNHSPNHSPDYICKKNIVMLTVSFLLKEPKAKGKTLIYMFAFFGGKKPLKYSLSEKVEPEFWNVEQQRVRIVRACPDAKAINLKIERYERAVREVVLKVENEGRPLAAETLKYELELVFDKAAQNEECFDFIKFYEKRTSEYKERKASNWKAYQTGVRLMGEFCKHKPCSFDDVDYLFCENFVVFLKNRNYSENYIGQQIKMLKAIMNYAYKIGLHKNDAFRNFKKSSEDIDNIYLTEKEIETIYYLDLKGYLERARDLFVIGCTTAMRYSDFTQIRCENISDGFIRYTSQKTGEITIVPVHWMIYELLEKYNGNLPRAISNQKMNEYLKTIGKLAGIDADVTKTRTEGGRRIKRSFKKYELITTHTARRSAATNMYKANFQTIAIMKITGHRTEKAFMTYIKISKEENAEMMANHPYFNKKIK